VIGTIIAGLLCAGAAAKAASAGDRAIKRAARGFTGAVGDAGRELQERIETVAPPCARGRAPHQRVSLDYYGDGTPAYACRKCGEQLE
jgi:hypothetical protein